MKVGQRWNLGWVWICLLAVGLWPRAGWCAELNVLCTTFPIYQITRNVAVGQAGVVVELLLPASLGCPHHYSLTPQDMRKLARADLLVVNGLGLEAFLGAPVQNANPRLTVVDSARGVTELLFYEEGPHDHDAHAPCEQNGSACVHAHQNNVNPHLFASPRQAAHLALNIAAGLSQADPDHASLYVQHARAYADRLNALADEMAAQVRTLRNNRIVQPHGVFDYLARDTGLEIVAVTQPHGREPSAAEMLHLVKTIRARQAGALVTEPQYAPKVGQTLARETGIPTLELDPVASGPDDAPLDYYESVMRQNLEALQTVLGRLGR
ncbi:MAG: metal ABC transporter substrate-binding protein [Candidatus Marinimicrobia bacterium]|nr:metal ABC transporter substrate-binding protein [Candidatus Neomarinimicrobiota bacterium]